MPPGSYWLLTSYGFALVEDVPPNGLRILGKAVKGADGFWTPFVGSQELPAETTHAAAREAVERKMREGTQKA